MDTREIVKALHRIRRALVVFEFRQALERLRDLVEELEDEIEAEQGPAPATEGASA